MSAKRKIKRCRKKHPDINNPFGTTWPNNIILYREENHSQVGEFHPARQIYSCAIIEVKF